MHLWTENVQIRSCTFRFPILAKVKFYVTGWDGRQCKINDLQLKNNEQNARTCMIAKRTLPIALTLLSVASLL